MTAQVSLGGVMKEPIDTYLTAKEVQKIVRMGKSSVYKLMYANQFSQCIRIGGREFSGLLTYCPAG
jgi:predicted DNA-binding transcriptional regulator AlpA